MTLPMSGGFFVCSGVVLCHILLLAFHILLQYFRHKGRFLRFNAKSVR